MALSRLEGRLVFACGGQIWTARRDGSDQQQVTRPSTIDWDGVRLDLSPTGNPPSREERATLEAEMNASPRWLSDGRIAFASIRDTLALSAESADGRKRFFAGASELYVINADGSGEQRVTDYNLTPESYERPNSEFSPAAECVGPTFCVAGMLMVTPFAGAHTEPVLAVEIVEIRFSECCHLFGSLDLSQPAPALDYSPFAGGRYAGWDWSADDEMTLSTVLIPSGVTLGFEGSQLRLSPAGQVRSIEAFANGASLSPDGSMFAYCTLMLRAPGPWEVHVAQAGEEGSRVLLTLESTLATRDCRPRWSPDGSHIVLNDGEGRIVVVDVATGVAVPVANGLSPDWGP
jgi:hypothetical protein